MNYSYFVCLLLILMVINPVLAAPVINPVVQSEPFLCKFWPTGWICDLVPTGGPGVPGATGQQGIAGEGNITNFFNVSESNITAISNITNFFTYNITWSEMNQTPNQTAGADGYTPVFGLDYFNGTDGQDGAPGDPGIAATINVNYTFTGAPGTSALVTNIGSTSAALLDFTIPEGQMNQTSGYTPIFGIDYFNGSIGETGANGTAATIAINSTFTLDAGESATVVNVGTESVAEFDFGIPQGMMNQTANQTPGPIGLTGATGGTGGQVLYFQHEPAGDPAGYEGLYTTPSGLSEVDEFVTVNSGIGEVLIDPYITSPDYPPLTQLPAGLWRFRTYHYVDQFGGDTNAVFKVYNRTAGGTETLLFSVASEDIDAQTPTEYLTSYVQAVNYSVALTDRLVIKVYGQTDSVSDKVVHFVYEGAIHTSHVQTPLAVVSTLYIRRDGTTTFTGSQSMGGFNLTNVLDPIGDQDAATKNYVDTEISGISNYNESYVEHSNLSYVLTNNLTYFLVDGSRALTGNMNAGGYRLTNISAPTTTGDALVYRAWGDWDSTPSWSGATPGSPTTVARWMQTGKTVSFIYHVYSSDSNATTGLVIASPVAPLNNNIRVSFSAFERAGAAGATYYPLVAYMLTTENYIRFGNFVTGTDNQAIIVSVSGQYEVPA